VARGARERQCPVVGTQPDPARIAFGRGGEESGNGLRHAPIIGDGGVYLNDRGVSRA